MPSELEVASIKSKTGTAAITIADGGAVTHNSDLIANDIKTESNSYKYAAGGELNSIGYLNHNFFGCSYYLSATQSVAHDTWAEVAGGTWTKIVTSGAAGSDDADPFGKFSGGRWTPTVSGYYLVCGSLEIPGVDDGDSAWMEFRRNGSSTAGNFVGRSKNISSGTNTTYQSSSGILPLDTSDYISMWCYHNGGGTENLGSTTTISITFVGTSDL